MRGHGDATPGMTQSCGDLGGGGKPSHAQLSCGTRAGGHSEAPVWLGTKRDSPACVAWGQQGARVPRGHTDPCIALSPPSVSAQGWGHRRCSPSPSTPPGRCTSPRCCKPGRGNGITPPTVTLPGCPPVPAAPLTPWSKQIFPSQLPGQELKLKALAGRHLRSRQSIPGPQGVPSST